MLLSCWFRNVVKLPNRRLPYRVSTEIGTVAPLVDAADEALPCDALHLGIHDALTERVREAFPADDLERSPKKASGGRVERRGERQGVVHAGKSSVGRAQGRFALGPGRGDLGLPQERLEFVGATEGGKRCTEPFGVGRVLAFHEKAQCHDVAHQSRANQRRAEFVAHVSGTRHQVFLLTDACPPRRQQIQPHVMGVECKPFAQCRKVPNAIVMHRTAREFAQPLR